MKRGYHSLASNFWLNISDVPFSCLKANRARRISVYTIGIAPGPPGGPLDAFMRALAEENLGIYRRVDR
jgi:hypothetical protein